jgi:outer membrane murein-binding lipoprotein Lpp
MAARPWNKEEDVKRLIAAMAILAVVFVMGCQDTKKVTELQGQVDTQKQQITEYEGQVAKLTVERDSLQKIVTDAAAKAEAKGGKSGGKTGGKTSGGRTVTPPKKK